MTYKKRGRKRGGEGETTAAAEPAAAATTNTPPGPAITTDAATTTDAPGPTATNVAQQVKHAAGKSMFGKMALGMVGEQGLTSLVEKGMSQAQSGSSNHSGAGQSGGPGAQALPVAAAVGSIQEAVPVVEGIPIEGKEEETGEPNYEKIAKLEIIKKLECFKLLQKNTKLDRVETAVFALEDYYKARVKPIKDCDIGYSKIYDQAKKTNNKLKYAIERLRKLKLVNEYGKPRLNAGMIYGFGSRRKKFLEDFAKNSVMKTASGIGSIVAVPFTTAELAKRAALRLSKKKLDKNPQDVEGPEEGPESKEGSEQRPETREGSEEGPEEGPNPVKNVKPKSAIEKNLKRYWDAGAGIASGVSSAASVVNKKAKTNANAAEAAGTAAIKGVKQVASYLNPLKKTAPSTGGANSTNGNTAKKAANGKNNETKKKPKYYKCEGLEDLVEKIMECIDAIAKLREDTDAKNCKVYFKDINKNLDKIVGEFESALKSVELAQKDTGPPPPPVNTKKTKPGFFSRMFSRNKKQNTTKQKTTKAPKKSLLSRMFSRKNKNPILGTSNGPVTENLLGKVLEGNNMQLSNESDIKGPQKEKRKKNNPGVPAGQGPKQEGPNQTGTNQKGPKQEGPNQKGPVNAGQGPNQKGPVNAGQGPVPAVQGPVNAVQGPVATNKGSTKVNAPQTTNTPQKNPQM